jgi:hypothetical protein
MTSMLFTFLGGIVVSATVCFWFGSSWIIVRRAGERHCFECTCRPSATNRTTDSAADSAAVVDKDVSNDTYTRVAQRLNKSMEWEPFDSSKPASKNLEFVVYDRHQRPGFVPQVETFVNIQAPILKQVLRDCVEYIDSVFDPDPLV